MAKILSVDMAFANAGCVVFEFKNNNWKPIETYLIKTKKSQRKKGIRAADDNTRRCSELASELSKIIKKHNISGLIAELPTGASQSSSSAYAMGMAIGVLSSVVSILNLSAEWVTPIDVKKAVGNRNASKTEVQDFIIKVFPGIEKNYIHNKGVHKGKVRNEFEHIADAAAAFISATNGILIPLTQKMS